MSVFSSTLGKTVLNTILIPARDGIAESNPLIPVDVPGRLEASNKLTYDAKQHFDIYLKVNDGSSQKMIAVTEISGFGFKRENEEVSGMTRDYTVNMPGQISYSDLTIGHVFTRDCFFLKWLTTGVLQGGAPRADIEIHMFPNPGQELIFTCYDAFPVDWSLRDLNMGMADTMEVTETVSFSYSSVKVRTGPGK